MKVFCNLLLLLSLVPLAACAADKSPTAPLVAGEDYTVIDNGRPLAPLNGKIEVVEVFGYVCPHCYHFESLLEPWAAKLPSYVRFSRAPAAFSGPWDAFARAYIAADRLGVAGKSHLAMFQALHEKHSMPIQNVMPEELAAFYANYGIKPERFVATIKDQETQKRFMAYRDIEIAWGIRQTPTMIVNGRYMIKGDSFKDLLTKTERMIRQLHTAAAPKH